MTSTAARLMQQLYTRLSETLMSLPASPEICLYQPQAEKNHDNSTHNSGKSRKNLYRGISFLTLSVWGLTLHVRI